MRMGENVKFSIVTISYNAEKVIAKTIESVINQNYDDYEYVFVDGASTDRTNDVINFYAEKLCEKGIMVTHISEKDRGISDGFAKGVDLSTGEVVVILNAADEMLPGTLSFLANNFPDTIDVLYGNIIWHDEVRNIEYIKKSKTPSHLEELKYTMVIKHAATYIRKTAYNQYGNYEIEYKYAMDTELLLRMFKAGAKFKYVDREFTIFQAGGVSDTHLIDGLKETGRIAQKYGENRVKIAFNLSRKYVHHKLAHFVRYTFMKRKNENELK